MGYTRIVQSGDTIELYEYQKNYVHPRKRDYTKNTRRASSHCDSDTFVRPRTHRSLKRAKERLIRLVSANLDTKETTAFLTLTLERERPVEVAYSYLSLYWKRLTKKYNGIRYIGVPEWQKRGVLHFHFLVWGLPREITDNKRERGTRNLQRQWHRGLCDVRIARYISPRLGGYLAKYLQKSFYDPRLRNRRAYTCSRNVRKVYSGGSNALADYLDELMPVDKLIDKEHQYDTLWLGVCRYTRFIKQKSEL